MHQVVQQRAQEKGRRNARRINRRGAVAQHYGNDADRNCRIEAGERAMGKIAVAKRGEGKHAEAHLRAESQ
jgi:hypothetical protein